MVRRSSTDKTITERKDGVRMKRLTLNVPEALAKDLAHRSIEEGRPMGDIVADALVEYVKRHGKPR